MEMNKNLCRRLGNLSLPVLLSVVLLASCRDEIETGAYTGPYIRFSVSEGSEWHSTRAAGGPQKRRSHGIPCSPCTAEMAILPFTCTRFTPTVSLPPLRTFVRTRPSLPVPRP